MKKEIPVEFEIGFADSNIKYFTAKDDDFTLYLECWNSDIVEIKFLNFVSLFATNYFRIADLIEVFESPLLERALNELYEKKPITHNFRVFKFINSDDIICLEIVCEDISLTKISN